MPHGVLFRGGAEGKIRRGIVEADLFEVIIGLTPNLFSGRQHPRCHLRAEQDTSPLSGAARCCS